MQSNSLEHFIVGWTLTVIGFLIIIFHRAIKEWHDYWNSRDFPVGYGSIWTGKYSRGGLIFTYGMIILVGAAFLGFGIFQIVHAFGG
jgi:hypothetical protein